MTKVFFRIEKANEKKYQYFFNLRDILRKEECIEHLKWQIVNAKLANLLFCT
jgi:hypothetical protein